VAASTLGESEVLDLLGIIRDGTLNEKDAALRFLAPVVRVRPRPSWLPAHWLDPVVAVMRDHSWDAAGAIAWHLVYGEDPDAAFEFLVSIPLDGLDDHQLRGLIRNLRLAPRELAFARLGDIVKLGGSIGAASLRAIENLGGITPSALAAVAEEWRESRSRDALNRLYHVFIVHQPAGSPIGPILDVLGPPTLENSHDYRWETDEEDPIQLAVFTDGAGCLDGFKLK